ncbi:MAG TPA: DUF502 domain-containing protein [Candidatus Krumholzibacteria bacterium]|jgi:uncharacterized membrane protein
MSFELPTFRRAFLTGLLVLAPLGLTLWVFVSLFRLIDGWINPLLQKVPILARLLPEGGITGIGFLTALSIVTLVGLFASNLLGRALFGALDAVLAKIPWIKPVYGAAKDLSGVVFGGRSSAFRRVVLFEYPRRGIFSLGFVTREANELPAGYLHIFLPTTPNPTSGFFLVIPAGDAIQLPISIEDGVKLVVSGGALLSGENSARLAAALAQLREG